MTRLTPSPQPHAWRRVEVLGTQPGPAHVPSSDRHTLPSAYRFGFSRVEGRVVGDRSRRGRADDRTHPPTQERGEIPRYPKINKGLIKILRNWKTIHPLGPLCSLGGKRGKRCPRYPAKKNTVKMGCCDGKKLNKHHPTRHPFPPAGPPETLCGGAGTGGGPAGAPQGTRGGGRHRR